MMLKKILEKLKAIRLLDRRLLGVLGLIVVVMLMLGFSTRITTLSQLTRQRKQLETRNEALMATQKALEDKIAYATSELALEEWAREEQRLVNPGDHAVIFLEPKDAAPTPQPTPPAPRPSLRPIDIWMTLLFGTELK